MDNPGLIVIGYYVLIRVSCFLTWSSIGTKYAGSNKFYSGLLAVNLTGATLRAPGLVDMWSLESGKEYKCGQLD